MNSLIYFQRMQHKYTMYGFEYGEVDPHDSVPTRAIKVLFRMNLPRLRPLIERKVRDVFDLELNKGSKLEGRFKSLQPSTMILIDFLRLDKHLGFQIL
jgi:hypothetical protein